MWLARHCQASYHSLGQVLLSILSQAEARHTCFLVALTAFSELSGLEFLCDNAQTGETSILWHVINVHCPDVTIRISKWLPFPFGFEGRIWHLMILVPAHCTSLYFFSLNNKLGACTLSNKLGAFSMSGLYYWFWTLKENSWWSGLCSPTYQPDLLYRAPVDVIRYKTPMCLSRC